MSLALKSIYAPAPAVRRGAPMSVGSDAKAGTIVYPCGNAIVIRNLADPLQADIYYEHTCQTTVAKYAPSGFYVASGDIQGNVRVWDTTQKEHILKVELKVLGGPIADIAWSADSQRICVVGDGKERYGAVFMWDAGSSVGEISGHTKTLVSCDIKPTRPFRLATGGEDNLVNWFEGPPFKYKLSLRDNTRMVTCVRFSPDGEKLATVSTDKKLVIYDGKAGTKLGEAEGHKGGVYSCAWSPDSKSLLTASADKTAALWDLSNPAAPAKKLDYALGTKTENQQLGTVWLGDKMISINLEGELTYLSPTSAAPVKVVHGHSKYIISLAIDAAGTYMYTASYDARIIRWTVATGETATFTGTGHTNQIEQMAVQGNNLVTCSMDNTVRITPLDTLTYGAAIDLENPAKGVAVGVKNTNLIAAVTIKNVFLILDGKVVTKLDVKYEPTCVAISADETEIAVGCSDKYIHLYKIAGSQLNEKKILSAGLRMGVSSLAYSPDGKSLASADLTRNIFVWDLQAAQEAGHVKIDGWCFHTATVKSLSWAPNGVNLASCGLDGSVYVWSTANPEKRGAVKSAHQGGTNVVSWLNNEVLVSAGQDCAVKSWTVTQP